MKARSAGSDRHAIVSGIGYALTDGDPMTFGRMSSYPLPSFIPASSIVMFRCGGFKRLGSMLVHLALRALSLSNLHTQMQAPLTIG